MSKGYSGLFDGTKGDKTSISDLKSIASEKVSRLIAETHGSKGKAMAVGAYDVRTGKTIAAFAGEIPKRIHPELFNRAKELGGIGSHGLTERNIVGVCAEFHVVNSLLLSGSKMSDIRLTTPIRPRTGTPIPYCENCKKMFADIINK